MTTRILKSASLLFAALLLAVSCSSSTEIGDSGITIEDLEEAARLSEERRPAAERPAASRDNVSIQANLCEVTDPDGLDDGMIRRVWVSVENQQPQIISVLIDITFTDGTVIQSDGNDVGALIDGDPGTNSFGTFDTTQQDASRDGDDCFDEIESVAIAEIGEPEWMTAEDDLLTRN